MKKLTLPVLIAVLLLPLTAPIVDGTLNACHAAAITIDDAAHDLNQRLVALRNETVVELVESNMKSHQRCMLANSVLNAAAQTCVAASVFTSSCAAYFKRPEVAFAASGIGVLAITLRGLADYAKKQGKEKLTRASALLRDEGVRSLDNYMRSDSTGTAEMPPLVGLASLTAQQGSRSRQASQGTTPNNSYSLHPLEPATATPPTVAAPAPILIPPTVETLHNRQ